MSESLKIRQSRKNRKDSSMDATLDLLVQRLVQGLRPEQIVLFGSHAYGAPTGESDLDIMIVVSESDELPHRRDQQAYKCVGAIGVSKDLLVLTRAEFDAQAQVATSVARRVKDEGTILYERGNTHRDLEVVGQEPA